MLNTSMRRRGFGYADLLVVLCAVMMLGASWLGGLAASRERANRVKCASNLRQIGQGMILYANDFKTYPRMAYKPDADLKYYTKAKDGTEPNDVTGAMFLLVKCVDMNGETFLCPTRQFTKDAARNKGQAQPAPKPERKWDLAKMHNFPGPDDLDYAVSNPYPTMASVKAGYKWSPDMPAVCAIAADMGSGDESIIKLTATAPADEIKKANSPNHGGEGQNVLFNDGHVEWSATPFCGALNDNIYTRAKTELVKAAPQPVKPAASEAGVAPAWEMDSVLVPTVKDK